jgi:hypothetical protein
LQDCLCKSRPRQRKNTHQSLVFKRTIRACLFNYYAVERKSKKNPTIEPNDGMALGKKEKTASGDSFNELGTIIK